MRIYGAKVVAFGDSITAGEGIPEGHPNWTDLLKNRFNLKLINSGIGGNTSSQGLERLDKDVLSHKPDFVLINFGMNDHVMEEKNKPKVAIKLFEENILEILNKVKGIGAEPILVTTSYIIEGDKNQYYYSRHNPAYYEEVGGAQAWLDKYIEIVRKISVITNTPIIDMRKACENYDRYDFLRSLKNNEIADGVHLNVVGASVYAQVIGDYLERNYD
jgi:lysophospholipase L1-like esterase